MGAWERGSNSRWSSRGLTGQGNQRRRSKGFQSVVGYARLSLDGRPGRVKRHEEKVHLPTGGGATFRTRKTCPPYYDG